MSNKKKMKDERLGLVDIINVYEQTKRLSLIGINDSSKPLHPSHSLFRLNNSSLEKVSKIGNISIDDDDSSDDNDEDIDQEQHLVSNSFIQGSTAILCSQHLTSIVHDHEESSVLENESITDYLDYIHHKTMLIQNNNSNNTVSGVINGNNNSDIIIASTNSSGISMNNNPDTSLSDNNCLKLNDISSKFVIENDIREYISMLAEQEEIFELLIRSKEIQLDVINKVGDTPLHIAVRNEKLAMIKELYHLYPSKSLQIKNNQKKTIDKLAKERDIDLKKLEKELEQDNAGIQKEGFWSSIFGNKKKKTKFSPSNSSSELQSRMSNMSRRNSLLVSVSWDPTKYAVGCDQIDSQHAQLIEWLKNLSEASLTSQSHWVVGYTIGCLIEYTEFHFSDEEQLLRFVFYF
ncbi:predicted protein [Naegleria gruberi]|uniref:Predicted protein n=1 Tax=Naegleria gruberi TaxID=5762 RepID=D2V0J3_NAEGR|nr:uncharacterized protein NAEGRDRAFT_45711 [Naegleria gruberi]EFC49732.1 predicted protein [Naegleria gruberi]|eukprot:XP_002682476.1 predicted protein [Naegleria gruberi strain NEG-M]